MKSDARGFWTSLLLTVFLAIGATLVITTLAPAAANEPEPKVFPHRPLPVEWNGARPALDVDHMFPRHARQERDWVNETFRRPR